MSIALACLLGLLATALPVEAVSTLNCAMVVLFVCRKSMFPTSLPERNGRL
jgi:hypothetical protein